MISSVYKNKIKKLFMRLSDSYFYKFFGTVIVRSFVYLYFELGDQLLKLFEANIILLAEK